MIVIELADQEAAALSAKAAAQGLTLQAWLKKLAEEELPSAIHSRKEAVRRIREIQERSKPDPQGWNVRDYIQMSQR